MSKAQSRESIISIDENNLYDECQEHSNKYLHYKDAVTEASSKQTDAENELKVLMSKLKMRLRNNPKKYFGFNGGKISNNDMLENVLETAFEKELAEAREKINDASYEVDMCKNMVASLYERRKMLEQMVKLQLEELDSGPSLTHSDEEELGKRKTRRGRKKQ